MFDQNALRRTEKKKLVQLSSSALKMWGMVFTLIGTFGVAVLNNGVLKLEGYTIGSLTEAMQPGTDIFILAGIIILCNAIATLALPIFCHQLVEGYVHTSSVPKYLVRLTCAALVCEAPFDLAMKGKWFDPSAQSPLLSLLISLLMLYFINRFERPGVVGGFIKAGIVAAAVVWAVLAQSQLGVFYVGLVAVYWFFRGGGMVLNAAAVVMSLLQFPGPFGVLFTHWYSGEKGKIPGWVFYVIYPAGLLLFGLIGVYYFA